MILKQTFCMASRANAGLMIQTFQNHCSGNPLGGWAIPEKSDPFKKDLAIGQQSLLSILMVITHQWCMR